MLFLLFVLQGFPPYLLLLTSPCYRQKVLLHSPLPFGQVVRCLQGEQPHLRKAQIHVQEMSFVKKVLGAPVKTPHSINIKL